MYFTGKYRPTLDPVEDTGRRTGRPLPPLAKGSSTTLVGLRTDHMTPEYPRESPSLTPVPDSPTLVLPRSRHVSRCHSCSSCLIPHHPSADLVQSLCASFSLLVIRVISHFNFPTGWDCKVVLPVVHLPSHISSGFS